MHDFFPAARTVRADGLSTPEEVSTVYSMIDTKKQLLTHLLTKLFHRIPTVALSLSLFFVLLVSALTLNTSVSAQSQPQRENASEQQDSLNVPQTLKKLEQTRIAILPPKGNLEEWPELEVEIAFHAVTLFQESGAQVLGPGQMTSALQSAGYTDCQSNDWIECALEMRQAIHVHHLILFQLILLRGKPHQFTMLVVDEQGLQISHTIDVREDKSIQSLLEQLVFEAWPMMQMAVNVRREYAALALSPPEESEGKLPLCEQVPGADLSLLPTETQYPIVGPALLGAAGVVLTSLAIATLASEKCIQRSIDGTCTSKQESSDAAVYGLGASGAAALTGALMWFLLGAEEVPLEAGSMETSPLEAGPIDEQAWGVSYRGKF